MATVLIFDHLRPMDSIKSGTKFNILSANFGEIIFPYIALKSGDDRDCLEINVAGLWTPVAVVSLPLRNILVSALNQTLTSSASRT